MHFCTYVCGQFFQILLVFSRHNNGFYAVVGGQPGIFSLIPPTGSTLPESVISPVMARFFLTLRPVNADIIAVAMVMPAEGPSLGIAPSGR